jgi:hypothetical protein
MESGMNQTLDTQNQSEAVVFVIFGGAGDLTWRKLIPSLFAPHPNRGLPNKFAIIGVDHAALSDETLRKRLHEGVRRFSKLGSIKAVDWKAFAEKISYPGTVVHGRPISEPYHLGCAWVGFNFKKAFGQAVKIINDAAMPALGSYQGGRMLFLGLGTLSSLDEGLQSIHF